MIAEEMVGAILNDIARVSDHPGLVMEQHINFTSVCYHHFLPFFGTSAAAPHAAAIARADSAGATGLDASASADGH